MREKRPGDEGCAPCRRMSRDSLWRRREAADQRGTPRTPEARSVPSARLAAVPAAPRHHRSMKRVARLRPSCPPARPRLVSFRGLCPLRPPPAPRACATPAPQAVIRCAEAKPVRALIAVEPAVGYARESAPLLPMREKRPGDEGCAPPESRWTVRTPEARSVPAARVAAVPAAPRHHRSMKRGNGWPARGRLARPPAQGLFPSGGFAPCDPRRRRVRSSSPHEGEEAGR